MPDGSKSLPHREPSSEEQEIINEVLDLYQAKPSEKAYSHYAQTAVFHDPVSLAKGLDSIKSQFNGMPKAFSKSVTKSCHVLDDPQNPNEIKLDLTQHYKYKLDGSEKTINSLVTLKMQDGMIQHHEEEWDHEPNKDSSDGIMGKLSELRKTTSAKISEKVVTSDPNKV